MTSCRHAVILPYEAPCVCAVQHMGHSLGPTVRQRITAFLCEQPTPPEARNSNGRPLIELAREYREITRYADIPTIVRDAILAAEDKRFLSHNGIDHFSMPRVLGRVRIGMLAGRLVRGGRHDEADGVSLFPQGGSTITQQLVRSSFLRPMTAQENSYQLRPT